MLIIAFYYFRVNWNELYDTDHYKTQERVYKTLRPTLLSNSLVVSSKQIHEHIRSLAANNYAAIKQQVKEYYRTNKTKTDASDTPASLTNVDINHHLQTYTIGVCYNV